eukprot:COSAG01_NODE_1038_length_11978_cov_4.983500_15_plen_271_part_00
MSRGGFVAGPVETAAPAARRSCLTHHRVHGASLLAVVLTEIYLCDVCSGQEMWCLLDRLRERQEAEASRRAIEEEEVAGRRAAEDRVRALQSSQLEVRSFLAARRCGRRAPGTASSAWWTGLAGVMGLGRAAWGCVRRRRGCAWRPRHARWRQSSGCWRRRRRGWRARRGCGPRRRRRVSRCRRRRSRRSGGPRCPFPPSAAPRAILTEIYRCNVCPCQEILRRAGKTSAAGHLGLADQRPRACVRRQRRRRSQKRRSRGLARSLRRSAR